MMYTRQAGFQRLAFLMLAVFTWWLLSSAGVWSRLVFPAPHEVGNAFIAGMRDRSIPIAVLASMQRMIVGYVFSVIVGVALGIALERWGWLDNTVGSFVMGLQSLPSICWLPLALLWFGLNERAILFVVVMGALFTITTATQDGIRHVPPLLVQAGQTLGARRWKLYLEVILPAALPSILIGLKAGWSFAWRSLMAGELLYSDIGLGRILTTGRELGDMAQVLSAILVIVALGWITNAVVFSPLEIAVRRRWGLAAPS